MNKQLGMPIGTATHRLKKMMMFQLSQKCNLDVCFRCSQRITKEQDLTLDHVLPWRGEETNRFWDLSNVLFSHAKCNFSAARRKRTPLEIKRKRKAEWMRKHYTTQARIEKKNRTGW